MPFTLAHPAAVLPFMRRPLNGLALVCGAMAPDVAYFIRATPIVVTAQSWYEPFTNATTSHSVSGLPVTLVLASGLYLLMLAAARPVTWLVQGRWEVFVRAPHPPAANESEGAAIRRSATRAWIPISLLVGVLTHLLWDSLTDGGGPLADRFDAVNRAALGDVSWLRLVQHASTVIGLAAVAYALWRRRGLVSEDPAVRHRAYWFLGGLLGIGAAAAMAMALTRFDPSSAHSTSDSVENVVSVAIKSAGAAVAAALFAATAVWWAALVSIRSRPGRTGEQSIDQTLDVDAPQPDHGPFNETDPVSP